MRSCRSSNRPDQVGINGHDLSDDDGVALADYVIALYEQDDRSHALEQLTDWLRERRGLN